MSEWRVGLLSFNFKMFDVDVVGRATLFFFFVLGTMFSNNYVCFINLYSMFGTLEIDLLLHWGKKKFGKSVEIIFSGVLPHLDVCISLERYCEV